MCYKLNLLKDLLYFYTIKPKSDHNLRKRLDRNYTDFFIFDHLENSGNAQFFENTNNLLNLALSIRLV